jgi:hypothetical protein
VNGWCISSHFGGLAVGQKYNEQVFAVHISSILYGALVGVGSLWACLSILKSSVKNASKSLLLSIQHLF